MLAFGCLCHGRLQPLGPHCFPFQKSRCQSLLQKRPQPGRACHSPIVLFIHQVVPGPEGHQVSIVCWRRNGHGARAAHVGVTQLVGENLQLIGRETIVIPKHVIVGRPACSLKADQRVREVNMQERSPELTCKGCCREKLCFHPTVESFTEDTVGGRSVARRYLYYPTMYHYKRASEPHIL